MANLAVPRTVTPAYWTEQTKNVDKKAADKVKPIGDKIGLFEKAGKGIEPGVFDIDKLATKDEISKRIDLLKGMQKSEVSALQKAADEVVKAANAAKDVDKKVADALKTIKSDAAAHVTAVSGQIDTALKSLENKLKTASAAAGKTPAKSAASAAPPDKKAAGNAKTLGGALKKTIALLKSGKTPPQPIRFLILRDDSTRPATIRMVLAPKPENQLARLKTLVNPKKAKKIQDKKATVIWEKGALTFVSGMLKVPAKMMQEAIKQQCNKLTVKVRIKKLDGSVEEADAPDVKDEDLKLDPEDEKAHQEELKNYAKRIAELKPDVDAYAGADKAQLQNLLKSAETLGKAQKFEEAAEALDDLESKLSPDLEESSGEDEAEAETPEQGVASQAAAKQAGQTPAGQAAAKSAAPPEGGDLAQLRGALKENVSSTLKGLEDVTLGLAKLFPAGQRPPNWQEALDKLKACSDGLKGLQIDGALAAVEKAKTPQERAQKIADVRKSVAAATSVVNSDVMKSLDAHGIPDVTNLSVAADLRRTLTSIASLR